MGAQNFTGVESKTPPNAIIVKIRSLYNSLTPALQRLADYVLENASNVSGLNISQLANTVNVSESTVIKFIRALGMNSFRDFTVAFAQISVVSDNEMEIYDDITLQDTVEVATQKVFGNNIEALRNTLMLIDYSMVDSAGDAICAARRIDIYGMGSSSVAALSAALRFYRLGLIAFNYSDPHQQVVSASLLSANDVAIGISNSGESVNIVDALNIARNSGAKTICITSCENSSITKNADYCFYTATRDSEVFYESVNARIAQLCVIDALYVNVVSKLKPLATSRLKLTGEAVKLQRLKLNK